MPGIGRLRVGVSFVTWLPLLILSAVSPFFRERLNASLLVKPEAPPALAAVASLGPAPSQILA
jgi:hypothetical protein